MSQMSSHLSCYSEDPRFLTLQIVVVWVLGHAAVQKRPCQVVHGILFVLHCLGDNLSVEMVVKTVVQVRLDRQRLVKELLKEVLKQQRRTKLLRGNQQEVDQARD